MKKLLLGTLLALWSTVASANVTCSLPFVLTNGTPADATQVMANYNAIVTCLTRAAAAGANTDITSILGLTTPLPPSQGGSWIYTTGSGQATYTAGSPSNYTISGLSPSNFTLTPGVIVYFMAPTGSTNTGPVTWTVNSTPATNVVTHTATGVSSLSGGEIVQNQVTLGYYDGVNWELLDAAPVTAFVQPCTEIDYQGVSTPNGYLSENGQTVSRTGFPNLFACMAVAGVAATTTNGNPTVSVPNSGLFQVGWYVGGNNVICNSQITSIPGGGLSIVLNNNASGNGATTLTIGPQPQGDCATTFNVPNANGRLAMGIDTGGITIAGPACANPGSVGSKCGVANQQIVVANLPAYTPSVSSITTVLNGGVGQLVQAPTGGSVNIGGTGSGGTLVGPSPVTTAVFNAQGGSSTPFLLQPVYTVLKAIKF